MATLAHRRSMVMILGADAVARTTVATRAGSFPSSAAAGQFFVLAGAAGSPDIVYQYVKNSSDSYEWVEVTRAT